MPCGCFGGGSKKKGSPLGSEGPPKPPKLPLEEPIKQQQQIQTQPLIPAFTAELQTQALPENGTAPVSENGPVTNSTGNGTINNGNEAMSTPEPPTIVDGGSSSKSSGARSRAELYAKRREFFRPLYDVSLMASNQRFSTPRSSNTLPSRGKRGAYLMGDGSGYITADGRYVAGEVVENTEGGIRYTNSGERVNEINRGGDGSSFVVNEGQYLDGDGRVIDRPPRPTSQPSGLAGQWDEFVEHDDRQPQDEFHQKHHQIVQQQQHTGNVPPPPPAPKEMNPHFVEFQEKHHKILYDPVSHNQHRNITDPAITQKLVESRLTELDKLHNEVQQHYEVRMKNGPIDVDSLVEKYTEERWRKMVELWESEGLVVEGGMVVVDEKGCVVEKEMKRSADGGHVVQKVTRVVERVGDYGETVIERFEQEGNREVKVIETKTEVVFDGNTVKHTEEILVERVVTTAGEEQLTTVTTIVTPPTPQIDMSIKVTPLAELTAEQIAEVQRDIERYDDEPLLELVDNFKNMQHVIERERFTEKEDQPKDPSSYRVSPPPSPPPSDSQSELPTTCTPPPSPQREHRPSAPVEESNLASMCASARDGSKETGIALTKGSATPPPSPPLQATTKQQS